MAQASNKRDLPKLKELIEQLKENRVSANHQAEYFLRCIIYCALMFIVIPIAGCMKLVASAEVLVAVLIAYTIAFALVFTVGIEILSHIFQKHNGKNFLLVISCLLGNAFGRLLLAVYVVFMIMMIYAENLFTAFTQSLDTYSAFKAVVAVNSILGIGLLTCVGMLWFVKRQMMVVVRGQNEDIRG